MPRGLSSFKVKTFSLLIQDVKKTERIEHETTHSSNISAFFCGHLFISM
jgi:hypothetical protein